MALAVYKTLDLTPTIEQILHTVSDGKQLSFTLKFTNRTEMEQSVRLAFARADVPTAGEYQEYITKIPAYGVLRESGFVLPEKIRIIGMAFNAGVSFNLWGFEELP